MSPCRASYQCTAQWRGCEVSRSHVQCIHSSALVNSAGQIVEIISGKKTNKVRVCQRCCLPTRKSSSGKADMKTGSIAWRKSKPWVAHLRAKHKLSVSVRFASSVFAQTQPPHPFNKKEVGVKSQRLYCHSGYEENEFLKCDRCFWQACRSNASHCLLPPWYVKCCGGVALNKQRPLAPFFSDSTTLPWQPVMAPSEVSRQEI